jgi:hypothetical protein
MTKIQRIKTGFWFGYKYCLFGLLLFKKEKEAEFSEAEFRLNQYFTIEVRKKGSPLYEIFGKSLKLKK